MDHEDTEKLRGHLQQADVQVNDEQLDQLVRFCHLLWEWNSKVNLTRHTDYERFVGRDVVDSTQLAAHLAQRENVLDVGTGGGVPGLLLAILRPDLQVSVCDSVRKKAVAVADIAEQMQLPVSVHAARAEQILDDSCFDTLTARAVGPMYKMLGWFQNHWSQMGRLLMVKGPRWVEERAEARHRGMMSGLQLRRLSTYSMPGTDSESVILSICPRK